MEELMNKIHSSLYGKEVRGPVAKALQIVYEKLIIPARNVEVMAARGTYARLDSRMDVNTKKIEEAKQQVDQLSTIFKL